MFTELSKVCPPTITHLDVSNNVLSSNAAYALCSTLQRLHGLRCLGLDGGPKGQLDYTAMCVMAQCLRYKTTLLKLSLVGVPISTASVGVLKQLVTHNTHLMDVCITVPQDAESGVTTAVAAMRGLLLGR